MATDIHAYLKNISMSAQKVRLVCDVVRGKPAVDAMTTLRFIPGVAAVHINKVLTSAVPMPKKTLGSAADNLYVYRHLC